MPVQAYLSRLRKVYVVLQSSIRVSDLGREAYSVYVAQSIGNTIKSCLRTIHDGLSGCH